MKAETTLQKSDRTFKVWEYQVSHGQLLIRSPKAPATSSSAECLSNLDLICLGVDYMAIPSILRGLELLPPTSEEIEYLQEVLGINTNPTNIQILASEGKRFPIVASHFSFFENDWDIFESPFEFRSHFRPNP